MKQDKNLYAVILAGGSGTRFWPRSRRNLPKQFLPILGQESLFQMTLKRIRACVAPDHVYIVTNQQYKKIILQQTRSLTIPGRNILLEPEGKNTAPAICWAAIRIYQHNKDAVMAVLPSDHLIARPLQFLHLLNKAVSLARSRFLVTFGIVPTRPETGFGYIKATKVKDVWKVDRFIEKPDARRAKRFVTAHNYFWNSGMFVWRCEDILDAFRKYLPKVFHLLMRFRGKNVSRFWEDLPNISVDYGILEKARNVAVIPARDLGWSDLGSWEALSEVLSADKKGNIFKGNIINIDSKNTFIQGDKRLIAAVGLQDMIIVDTDDALLVCPKDKSQDVKTIVERLKKKGKEYL